MLVNCPKCGFTQPKDQYCAQCGVDMHAYRPPEVPLLRRLISNPMLQLGLVLLMAAGGGYSIYRQRQADLEDRVRYLQGNVQVARSLSASAGETFEEDSSEIAPIMSPPPDDAIDTASVRNAPASETSEDQASLAAEAAPPANNPATPAASTQPRVRLIFAEVSTPGLGALYEESRATGQFNQLGDHDAGLIPNLSQKLSSSPRDIKILHQIERPLASGSLQLFLGVRPGDPENEMGFSIFLERTGDPSRLSRGTLEIVRSWRERFNPSAPLLPQRRNYPAVFELAPSAGFFMAGLLPADGLTQLDQPLLAVPPFQILRSNEFRTGTSELVIFIEFLR